MTPEVAAAENALEVLENLPGLRSLPSAVRAVVVDAFEPVSYGFASVIVCEDEEADAFYVIVSGTARVVKRSEEGEEVSLHVLRSGDYFGEIGLLEESTRIATVRAREPVEAMRLDRSVFLALVRQFPDVRGSFERLARTRVALNFLRLHSVFASLPRTDCSSSQRGSSRCRSVPGRSSSEPASRRVRCTSSSEAGYASSVMGPISSISTQATSLASSRSSITGRAKRRSRL